MSASSDCLDDATIAALAGGESAAREALAHLESCGSCRELVSAVCMRRTNAEPERAPRLGPGTLLGRHRIERPLGSGGMGIVYLARDVELDREVAVKLLRGSNDRSHERLVRESQALARLNHPNVVIAHEVGRHAGSTYLIMEHVDGGTVRDWIAVSPRALVDIATVYAQCARGLAAAHAAGLVHRDIKPDNLLVGRDGRARVSDFGLATQDDGSSGVAGTPRYMAPEVLAGERADERSDQWSLCASLWESLFGAPPFAGTTHEELVAAMVRGDPEPPDEPALPAWLRRALLRGLARDPLARFASLDSLAEALTPSQRPFRRTAMLVVASATLAAGIGAAVGAREPEPSCRSDLADVWSAGKRTQLAATLGEPATAAISDYAAKWSLQRADVCRAERADGGGRVPALRAACLDVRRRALATLVDVLASADRDAVAHAPDAVGHLPSLEDCTAAERLAGRQPRPPDRVRQTELITLERRFDAARVRSDLGQRRAQLAELLAIAQRAAAIDYQPLAADALDTAGRELQVLGDPTALPTLRRALWAAQAGGDDHQLSDVAIALVSVAAETNRPVTERDEMRALARAAVARLRWRNDPSALAAASMLAAAEGNDDLARGDLEAATRELREAIELGVTAFGARSARLAPARSKLAKVLEPNEPDGAAIIRAASIDVDGGPGAVTSALIDAGWKLHNVGRDVQARELVHKARAVAQGSPGFLAVMLDDLESEIALALGDLDAAETLNDRAFAELGASPISAHAAGLRVTRGRIRGARGDCAAAEVELRGALEGLQNDLEARQVARLGLARCLAETGKQDEARTMVESDVAAGIVQAHERPSAYLLLAELRWRAGDREGARRAARDGHAFADKLPALVDARRALDAWSAAH